MIKLENLVKRKGPLSKKQLGLVRKWLDEDWEACDQDRQMVDLVSRLVATCEAPVPKSVENRLKSMIIGLLGGPRGDPDKHHMLAAAHCVLLLKELGFSYDEEHTIDHLSNNDEDDEGGNIHEFDFMEAARKGTVL